LYVEIVIGVKKKKEKGKKQRAERATGRTERVFEKFNIID